MDGDRGLRSSLEVFDGKVSGYVETGFPFALENAALFFYGQVLPLGSLEPGEVRWLQDEELFVWPVGLPYLAVSYTHLILQEGLQIRPDETVVFGDQMNDVEMLRQAYYSFAVANARPEVIKEARFLADSNRGKGPLKIMKLFL